MDFVLGLSVTSAGTRAVLVEGAAGDGATLDQFSSATTDDLVLALSENPTFGPALNAAASGDGISTIGVTCSHDATTAAGLVVDDLLARGCRNVVSVSELDAAEALATGLADLAGYTEIAVCIAEPDDAVIAVVGADDVVLDGIGRAAAPAPENIADHLLTTLGDTAATPQAVFVVGSAPDVGDVAAALEATLEVPVLSAQEGDLALARGAALASARSAAVAYPPARPLRLTRVGVLSSVLVAASLTFVVSLSLALTPQPASEQRATSPTAGDARPVAGPPSAPKVVPSAPEAPPPAPEAPPAPPPEAPEILPEQLEPEQVAPVREVASAQQRWQAPAAPPPAPEAPAPAPPPAAPPPAPENVAPAPVSTPPEPAHVPPAPEYTPPQPPAVQPPGYVPPPVDPAPQPRLRDRIIERIPILNRFHEPQFPG